MGIFDKLDKSKGGYIFLSHSHDDIKEVREIRNSLEQNGFEPLCFYLKCLTDEDEIEDLIKREIDAREWFIFVDSDNSRKSRWVTLERSYITKTDSKKIITVNLNDRQAVADALNTITHNLRVFPSYSHKDDALARRIKDKLIERDYLVFFAPESIPDRTDFVQVIADALIEASKEGCVIALLSPNSLDSVWVKEELFFALEKQGNVIPVMIGDFELPAWLRMVLYKHQWYHLPEQPSDEELDRLIDTIGQAILNKSAP